MNGDNRLIDERRYRVRYGTGDVEILTVAQAAPSGLWSAVGVEDWRTHLDAETAAGVTAGLVSRVRDTYVCNLAPVGVESAHRDEVENDWRAFPTAGEVLAHNSRTGGDCYGPWLRLRDPADEYGAPEVEMLAAGDDGYPVGILDKDDSDTTGLWRPVSRRGAAMPWPVVKP